MIACCFLYTLLYGLLFSDMRQFYDYFVQLCEIWAEDQRANQTNCLTEDQMRTLATNMREYIHTQDSTSLDNYLKELVNETISHGSWSMEELQRSIYSLNEAVSQF